MLWLIMHDVSEEIRESGWKLHILYATSSSRKFVCKLEKPEVTHLANRSILLDMQKTRSITYVHIYAYVTLHTVAMKFLFVRQLVTGLRVVQDFLFSSKKVY